MILDEFLAAAEQLDDESLAALALALADRVIQRKRDQLAEAVAESRHDYAAGRYEAASGDALIREAPGRCTPSSGRPGSPVT